MNEHSTGDNPNDDVLEEVGVVAEILESLGESFERRERDKFSHLIDVLFKTYDEEGITLPSPSRFSRDVRSFPVESINVVSSAVVSRSGLSSPESWRIRCLFENRGIIFKVVRREMERHEGFIYCADRARSILNVFVDMEMRERKGSNVGIPPIVIDDRWSLPPVHSLPVWLGLVDALISMCAGGDVTKVTKSFDELKSFYGGEE